MKYNEIITIINWLLLFVWIILLTACTTCPVCPTCSCPEQKQQEQTITEDFTITFIDVGQGDSILIKYKNEEMLIDCGRNSDDIMDNLEGITELEYLLITHPDSDHIGGCQDVIEDINVRTIIMNGDSKDTYTFQRFMDAITTEQLITAVTGDLWHIGPAKIKVIQSNNNFEDVNQNSIVTKLTYNTVTALFPGDCDKDCEDMLNTKSIESDILKVPHHGSRYGSSARFLSNVDPEIAIISVGADNRYGHPTQETLDRLEQTGITVYRTDYEGDIKIKIGENSYELV